MNLFFDSSALLKRYLDEAGSISTQQLFESADRVFVSAITHIECVSSFQRLLHQKFIGEKDYKRLQTEINFDFPFFEAVQFNEEVKSYALKIVEKYPLKALDTIQLASLLQVANEIDSFVVCDQKLKKIAVKEGFHIVDPTENP
jgi:predicted nucleic acid-binding protein